MRVFGIRWMEGPVSPLTMSYQIPCPEGTDEAELQKTIDTIMESDTWNYTVEYLRDGGPWQKELEMRADVRELSIKEHRICMKVSAMASPYQIYQALLGIPWEIAGKYRAERTQITFSPVSSFP